MKRILLLLCLPLLLAGCCRPPVIGSQPVTLRAQDTGMWCWAASAQMVMQHLGTNVSQCTQANDRFGRSDCCNSPVPNACVNGGWPEFDRYGFSFQTTSDAPLSWADVRKEIHCRKKPFAYSWHWNGGGGHMMVVIGYVTIDGVNYVTINDPWAPGVGDQRVITYDAYVSGAGYTHWNDYYNVTRL
ncbi:papain-like cysteine protease family protein [Luteimonas kalidii]|uniref:Papain-like cysteine protease family protein n=1 Tax=Luteimonas kalidii TaxID=3042025 RepID=A0ABT6JX51_9GAMM|nr:papain-like cysteine protease family protein [Luteimonas kalidii]MDH5835263.1 papain-like cysteine protease family protein [Luteimonas kalidii]